MTAARRLERTVEFGRAREYDRPNEHCDYNEGVAMSETSNDRRPWAKAIIATVALVVAAVGLAWIGFAHAERQDVAGGVIGIVSILAAGIALAGAVVCAVALFSPLEARPRRLAAASLALAIAGWLVFWVLATWIVPLLQFAMPPNSGAMTQFLGFGLIGVGVALAAVVLAIVGLVRRWGRTVPILALGVALIPPLFVVLSMTVFAPLLSTPMLT
jgi:hypothetical protein